MSISVRQAGVEDIDVLVKLRIAFVEELKTGEPAVSADEFAASVRESILSMTAAGDLVSWLAEVDGEPVGVSMVAFQHRPPSYSNVTGVEAYVMNVYTAPEWRGRGIATRLVGTLLGHVRSTDARVASLHATEQGRSVYEKLGFKATDKAMMMRIAE